MLAILEKLNYIVPAYDPDGKVINLSAGSIAAGYQNFLICIEMFFAAVALRYAFPISTYIAEGCLNANGTGRSVTMQSISSSLKVGTIINALFTRDRYRAALAAYYYRAFTVSSG